MYSLASSGDLLTQGDILAACPINEWGLSDEISNSKWGISQAYHRVLVLTQACDLMNSKAQRVQIAAYSVEQPFATMFDCIESLECTFYLNGRSICRSR
jgi:hypothetical protein